MTLSKPATLLENIFEVMQYSKREGNVRPRSNGPTRLKTWTRLMLKSVLRYNETAREDLFMTVDVYKTKQSKVLPREDQHNKFWNNCLCCAQNIRLPNVIHWDIELRCRRRRSRVLYLIYLPYTFSRNVMPPVAIYVHSTPRILDVGKSSWCFSC